MGKLLSLLARDDSNCCSSPRYDIFLDFENAAPTETEREVYEEVQRVLLDSEKILEEIQCYKGAGKEIREAIADPSRISQERAWRAIKPLVDKLLRCYNHSLELQRVSHIIMTLRTYKFFLAKSEMLNSHLERSNSLLISKFNNDSQNWVPSYIASHKFHV